MTPTYGTLFFSFSLFFFPLLFFSRPVVIAICLRVNERFAMFEQFAYALKMSEAAGLWVSRWTNGV